MLAAAAPAGAVILTVETTADNSTDDGLCSLREAITATNAGNADETPAKHKFTVRR